MKDNLLFLNHQVISYIITIITFIAFIKLSDQHNDEYLDMPDLLTDVDTDSDSD